MLSREIREALESGNNIVVRHTPGDGCLEMMRRELGRTGKFAFDVGSPHELVLALSKTVVDAEQFPPPILAEIIETAPRMQRSMGESIDPLVLLTDARRYIPVTVPTGWKVVSYTPEYLADPVYLVRQPKRPTEAEMKAMENLYTELSKSAEEQRARKLEERPKQYYTMEIIPTSDGGLCKADEYVVSVVNTRNPGVPPYSRLRLTAAYTVPPADQPKITVPADEKKAFEKMADLLCAKIDGTSNWTDLLEHGQRYIQDLKTDARVANTALTSARGENIYLRMRCLKMGDEYGRNLREEKEVIADLRTTVARLEEEKTQLLKQLRKK